jgi:chemotaxis protein MotB
VARKRKHEEHVNLERWVISYADMITLLFALFVVLYALGLDKMKNEVAKSIMWALHLEGEGKTQEQGVYTEGKAGGTLLVDVPPTINAQKGPMREYLRETLPEEFNEITGNSLEVVINDDTVAFRCSLSALFPKGKKEVRKDVHEWLGKLVKNSHEIASNLRIVIEAPMVRIGIKENGTAKKSIELCWERLTHLESLVTLMDVDPTRIRLEFNYKAFPSSAKDWEEVAQISFAFANRFPSTDGDNFKENPLGR